jgi:hypothetical protein
MTAEERAELTRQVIALAEKMLYGPKVGDRVRVERDETRYPSKGTWPRFRGKTGTVVEVNNGPGGPTEYGVVFRTAPAGPWRKWWSGGEATWFKLHELTPLAAQRPVHSSFTTSAIDTTREALPA